MNDTSHPAIVIPADLDSLVVDVGLLGTAWPIGSPDGRRQLYLPTASGDSGQVQSLSPPAVEPAIAEWFESEVFRLSRDAQYGWGYSIANSKVCVLNAALAWVPKLAPEHDEPGAPVTIAAQINNWLRNLWMWLDLLVPGLLLPRMGRPQQRFLLDRMAVVTSPNEVEHYGGVPYESTGLNLPTFDPPSPSLWTDAIERVNRGDEAPLEHVLLREGREASARDDYRKAVLDFAASTEVALSTSILRKLLTTKSTAAAGKLLDQQNGLNDLSTLAHSLGIVHPISKRKLRECLARPRNRAVHAGAKPDAETAVNAFKTASAIVETLSPL